MQSKPTESQLVESPAIGTHHILRNDAQRLLVVDHQRSVKFSTLQYRALKPLLSGSGIAREDLLEEVYGESADCYDYMTLDYVIRAVRSRLRPAGLSIARVEGTNYQLVAIPEPSERKKQKQADGSL